MLKLASEDVWKMPGKLATAACYIYSKTITIAARPAEQRQFRLFIDVIDIANVLVASEALHQAFVGIPYKIEL